MAAARTDLGIFIRCILDRRGWSARDLGERLGVGTMPINVISGRASIPAARVGEWAEALGLTGDDRKRFMDLAEAQAAKRQKRGRAYVEGLERQVRALEGRIRQLEAEAQENREDAQRLLDQLEHGQPGGPGPL